MILGLTGGVGSGKSTVAKELKKYGFKVVDADAECRKLTSKGSDTLNQLVALFGDEILTKAGVLNRRKLAKIVFASPTKLNKLNSVIHKQALKVCREKIFKYSSSGYNVVFDVPLMFETGWNKYCDKVLTVSADEELRIKRTVLRDGCKKEDVISRMSKQFSDAQREEKADFSMRNDKDLKALESSVASFVKSLHV